MINLNFNSILIISIIIINLSINASCGWSGNQCGNYNTRCETWRNVSCCAELTCNFFYRPNEDNKWPRLCGKKCGTINADCTGIDDSCCDNLICEKPSPITPRGSNPDKYCQKCMENEGAECNPGVGKYCCAGLECKTGLNVNHYQGNNAFVGYCAGPCKTLNETCDKNSRCCNGFDCVDKNLFIANNTGICRPSCVGKLKECTNNKESCCKGFVCHIGNTGKRFFCTSPQSVSKPFATVCERKTNKCDLTKDPTKWCCVGWECVEDKPNNHICRLKKKITTPKQPSSKDCVKEDGNFTSGKETCCEGLVSHTYPIAIRKPAKNISFCGPPPKECVFKRFNDCKYKPCCANTTYICYFYYAPDHHSKKQSWKCA